MASYNYLNQSLQASVLIQPFDNESFFFPVETGHTGFAYDGTHYTNGVQDAGPVLASWYTEAPGPYRGDGAKFPSQAIVLLSQVALTIMDETQNSLPLWMQFILQNNQLLDNNFEFGAGGLIGFTPVTLDYANGVISVTCTPDAGSTIQSNMVITIDFVADTGYLYVALQP